MVNTTLRSLMDSMDAIIETDGSPETAVDDLSEAYETDLIDRAMQFTKVAMDDVKSNNLSGAMSALEEVYASLRVYMLDSAEK